MSVRDQVFISYSHKDDEHLQRLKVHLKPFEREHQIKVWSDKKIKASQKWREEIQNALERTAVAILLLSADFLSSDFIMDNELPPLLDAAETKGVKILSVILKPCAFNQFPNLAKFQAVNDPTKPLISLDESDREQKWAEVAQITKEALDEFKAKAVASNAARQASRPHPSQYEWGKVATLFWLGNDLMWIQKMIEDDAPEDRILQALDNVESYWKELGFRKDSFPIMQLQRAKLFAIPSRTFVPRPSIGIVDLLMQNARKGDVPNYDFERRQSMNHLYNLIESLKWFIHELAIKEQPDFKKFRVPRN